MRRAPAPRRTSTGSSSGGVYYPASAEPTVEKHTTRDAVIGATAGAVIGASTSRDKVKGGLIGAAVGGILGGVIGSKVDVKKYWSEPWRGNRVFAKAMPHADSLPLPPDSDSLADEASDEQPDRRRRRLLANRAFGALKAQHKAERSLIEAIADGLIAVAASSRFIVVHIVWFALWVVWNLGWLHVKPFDPYPFGLLTMVVSLEAIFLAIFVLLAQKRESAIAELREELALQVNLRIEEETTKTLQLVAGLYTRLGQRMAEDHELHEMMQPLDVAALERTIQEQIADGIAAEHADQTTSPLGDAADPQRARTVE